MNKLMPERQRQLMISKDTESFIQNHRKIIEQVKAKLKNATEPIDKPYIHKGRSEKKHVKSSYMDAFKGFNE